jgi:hypothetical protein
MNDTNHDAHIKNFKKTIRVNGEIVKIDIINLFGFILQNKIQSGVKTLYNIISICHNPNLGLTTKAKAYKGTGQE